MRKGKAPVGQTSIDRRLIAAGVATVAVVAMVTAVAVIPDRRGEVRLGSQPASGSLGGLEDEVSLTQATTVPGEPSDGGTTSTTAGTGAETATPASGPPASEAAPSASAATTTTSSTSSTSTARPTLTGMVVFARTTPEQAELWVVGYDGSGARRLLGRAGSSDVHPAVSPDGTKIAWVRVFPGVGPRQLLVADADGANERLLVSAPDVAQPAWKPDGSEIAYSDNGALKVVPAAGGQPQTLLPASERNRAATWHPDASHLILDTQAGDDKPLRRYDVASRQVSSYDKTGLAPRYSRGGDLVWMVRRQHTAGYDLAFSGRDRIYCPGANGCFDPAITPDGQSVVYSHPDTRRIMLRPLVGTGEPRALTDGSHNDQQPAPA